ncbi:putative cytochrome b5-like heme/steroid binding domain superfamily [Helianthus annuus]|nr:putative cytochrome b5-like heme/steroid binding domain superfamily [Helianthus annuus]
MMESFTTRAVRRTLGISDLGASQSQLKIKEGKDATNEFEDAGHSKSARELMETFCVGELDPSDIPQLEVVSVKQKKLHP